MERLGVLGGTFDPPHLGHLALAEAARQQLRLEQVLWAPAGHPPHKRVHSSARHRLAMTELAITSHPRFALCRLDLDRPGHHYTADLLDLLRVQYPAPAIIHFLVGQDSLSELAKWRAPERILSAARLAVYRRPGVKVDWEALERVAPGARTRIDWLEGPPLEPASYLIRELVKQGQPIMHLVPPAVGSYIKAHRLYQASPGATG